MSRGPHPPPECYGEGVVRDLEYQAMRNTLAVMVVLGLAGAALFLASRWRAGDEGRRGAVEVSAHDVSVVPQPERVALEVPQPAPDQKPPTVAEENPEEPARVEAPVADPAWVQEILRSTPEGWKESHKGKSSEDRLSEKQKIYDYINERSASELTRMQEARQWELISRAEPGNNLSYHHTKEDEGLIYSVVMLHDDGVYKVVLPRELFPDLYTLKERANTIW